MEARLEKGIHPVSAVMGVAQEPFGMAAGFLFVQASRQIDGSVDADGMGGFNLCAEQVKRQIWMALIGLGGVIGPAVMALGEDGNGVDVPAPELLLKLCGREVRAHMRNGFGRVEVQMHLTETKGIRIHSVFIPDISSPRRAFPPSAGGVVRPATKNNGVQTRGINKKCFSIAET